MKPGSGPAPSLGERLEAWVAIGAFKLFGLLPLEAASGLGGWIGRTIGPRLGITRRARRNLERALPELDRAAQDRALTEMWDNLGRVVTEYAHLTKLTAFKPDSPIEVRGLEHVDAARAKGKPILFFSGHLANWETAVVTAAQYGLEMVLVYRAANNPAVDQAMTDLRRSLGVELVSKGESGARRIVLALRQGRSLAMLVDQKMNDGIAVPFFGRDAMTAPAIAELALRYDGTILPIEIERRRGARFQVTVHPPVPLEPTGDRHADVLAVMTRINRILETWIRARPGQWFWLHRRWPDS